MSLFSDIRDVPAPRRPPPIIWGIALLTAIAGGFLASVPLIAIAALGAGALLYLLHRILAKPILGIQLALCFFPFYPALRGISLLHKIPLPYAVLGLWPEMILGVILLSLILQSIRSGKRLAVRPFDLPPLLACLGGMYGVLLSVMEHNPVAAFYGIHSALTPVGFYFALRWLRPNAREARRLIVCWLLPFAIMGVISFFDYFYRPDYLIEVSILVRPGFWKYGDPHVFFRLYPRMASLIYWEINWGTLCALTLLYSGYQFAYATARERLIVHLPLILLTLSGIVFSMSRGAMLLLATAMGVGLMTPGKHRKYFFCLAIFSLFAVAALLVTGAEDGRIQSLVKRTEALGDQKDELHQTRQAMLTDALAAFKLFPAGRGLGRAGTSAVVHGGGDGYGAVTDGGYFQLMTEQGVPGVFIFVIGATGQIIVFLSVLRATKGEKRTLPLLVLSFYAGMLVENSGANIFDVYFLTPLFYLLAALAINQAETPNSQGLLPDSPPPALEETARWQGVRLDSKERYYRR